MKKKIIDHELPLTNENHEAFCVEYVRLDVEDRIVNKRARRVKAYRFIYPETIGEADSVCSSRATALLAKKTIRDRIANIYEELGTSVEAEYAWNRVKSEELLVEIAVDDSQKAGDRIKAIGELNKMRGIEVPKVIEEEVKGDSIDTFFSKFKGMLDG